ncbi:MAG: hypothetical protein J3K34DRAFT_527494 [Monoraphidium minutum]|nr:MAG: hypothetical protein J3K34DRAFT_527494 [Monoraphidium minutum]
MRGSIASCSCCAMPPTASVTAAPTCAPTLCSNMPWIAARSSALVPVGWGCSCEPNPAACCPSGPAALCGLGLRARRRFMPLSMPPCEPPGLPGDCMISGDELMVNW